MPNKDTLDERVVEMKIDNRQFVKGANNTISVLDKLKNALNFKNADKGFNQITKAANSVDLGGLAKALETIEDKVDYLGSKTHRIIENMMDDVFNFTKRTVKMFTTDQITAGWSKYEDMTSSIHTIMGATADRWDQTLERIGRDYGFIGSQMDFVSMQMDKLLWFTDETSASFVDMTNNIGKFTNAGVELDEAAVAMMGISTWGYKAGAGIEKQAMAMYNLSQAMGLGKVTLLDWKSVENANMGTMEFKQTVLETAAELGTLKVDAEGVFRTIEKGEEVSATNFRDMLSDGFFTSDVLMASLYKYGHFASLLQQVTEETGVNTRDMLKMVEEYKNGTFDANKAQARLFETMGRETPSLKVLNSTMELLGQTEDDLGYKAFLASQETKTLTEAIDYTKDAVSSGWMKTWEYVFGDYEEAKEFWSDVADELYELFVKAGERRNAILRFWKEEGGRDELIQSLWNVYDAIMNIVSPIRDAFKTIFGLDSNSEKAAQKILDLTHRFKEFTEGLFVSEDTLKGMNVVFTKLFSVVKTGFGYLRKVLSFVGTIFSYIGKIAGAFFRAFSSGTFDSTRFLGELNDIFGDIGSKITDAWNKLKKFLEGLYEIPVIGPIIKILITVFDKFGGVIKWIISKIKEIKISGEGLKGPLAFLNDTFENLWNFIKGINVDGSKVEGVFKKISTLFSTLWEGLVGDPEEFKNKVKNILKLLWDALSEEAKNIDFNKLMQGAKTGILIYIAAQFANVANTFKQATKSLKSIPDAISGVFSSIQDTFKSIQKSINANTYIKIAAAIAILAWAILELSKIDDNKFMTVAATLVIVFALIAKAAKSLEKSTMFSGDQKIGVLVKNLSKTAQSLIGLGVLIAAAAYAMSQVANLTGGQIAKGLLVIAIIIAMSIAAIKDLNKVVTDEQGNLKSVLKLAAFASIITAIAKALIPLANLKVENVLVAAISIGLVIAAVALVLAQASKIDSGAMGIIGIIAALSVAIMALTIPLTVLALVAKENLNGLALAAVIIGALVVIMAVFMKIGAQIGDMPGFNKFAKTLLIISAAMLIFAIATAIVVPAMLAIIGTISALATVITALPQDIFETMASRLAIIGAALMPLALTALIAGAGVLAFGMGLLAASAGVGLFSLSILGMAAAIALVALAVKLFVSAVAKIVETVSQYGDQFIETLRWLLLAVVGLLLGYRMYIANAALTIIITIITVLASVGGDKIVELVRFLILKVAAVLYQLVGLLADLLFGFIVYLINAVTNSIQKNKEALIIAIERLIGTILSLILETAIRLIFDAVDALFGFIATIFGANPEDSALHFSEWGKNLADGIGASMTDGFEQSYREAELAASKTGEKTGGTMVAMAEEGAEAKMPDLSDTLTGIIGSVSQDADKEAKDDSNTIGQNYMTGFINGAGEKMPDVIDMVSGYGGDINAAFAESLGEHSPSRITEGFGKYYDLGLALGIRRNIDSIDDANHSLADSMNSSLLGVMGIVGRIADEDLAIRPLIKPVVDMSDVNSANSAMSSMFNNSGNIDIGAVNARVSEAAERAASVYDNAAAQATDAMVGDSFVINVYSQPGMDENDLANAVMYKIQNGIIRKGAALG